MLMRAKDSFWWPGLSGDKDPVRALCQICHQNAPSQAKEPSFGVPVTNYAYESMCCEHFFLKGNEFLALVDRHSGMMSCNNSSYSGAKVFFLQSKGALSEIWCAPGNLHGRSSCVYVSSDTRFLQDI